MSSIELKRLARRIARLEREQANQGKPQLAYSSIENGNLKSYEGGDLKMIVGMQDDGGQTTQVFNGPTPPTPIGFTVDVDHGKFIVHWSGDFDGDKLAPSDWSRAEVHASQDPFFVPSRATARGSIVSAAGGEVTIGVLKGPWTIKMLAWSQAGKMSAPSAPVDVEVPGYGEIVLTEIDAANTEIKNGNAILVNAQDTLGGKLDSAFGQIDGINDDLSNLGDAVEGAITSANGKNTVHFDDHAPGPDDEGVAGDTWFVGQVGRPNDVIEAVNEALNPSFTSLNNQMYSGQMYASSGTAAIVTSDWSESGDTALEIRPTSTNNTTAVDCITRENPATAVDAGRTITISANIHLPAAQTGSQWSNARRIIVRTSSGGSSNFSYALSDQAPNAAGSTRLSVTFTLPEQLDYWYFLLGNGSSSTRVYWDSLRIGGSTYFDGDTESGATDDDPHYRWTGTPHESTSEKYLPAQFSGSDKWNVTEQYRHDGTGWVQVELSHNVISSVDIGALTAGSAAIKEAVVQKLFAEVVVSKMAVADEFIGENAILTGAVTASKITASEELWAKLAQFVRVNAEMVDSDVFRGRVFEGNTYLQDDGSEWSGRGLFIVAPDGETLLNVPTNGEPVTINADNTAIRSASIDKLDAGDTSLTTGSTLTLEAGQLAYPRAPEIRADWYPSATFDRPDVGHSYDWLGLAAWGEKWVRTVNVLGAVGADLDALVVYDKHGTVEKTINIDNNPRHGVAVIEDIAYVLGPDRVERPGPEKNWVHGFDLNTGNRVSRWEFTRFSGAPNRLALGARGSDLIVAGATLETDRRLYVLTFDPTSGVYTRPDISTDEWVKYTKDVEGVHIDGDTMWVSHREATRKFTISSPSGSSTDLATYDPSGAWTNPNKNAAGLDMSNGWPFIVTQSGNLLEGSVFEGDTTTIEAAITFRDTAGHETNASPTGTISVPARNSAAVSVPSRPGLTTRLYYREAGYLWRWADVDEGTKRLWIDFIPTQGGVNLPDTNSFPNADPSIMQAAAGPFVARGDGSGRWGPLTFNADGTMTSSSIPAWIPVTTFIGGASVQTFGFAPAYRVWPDGKVEWRGVVATPDTTGSTAFVTIPAAARPNSIVYLNGIGNSAQMVRIDFSTTVTAQPFSGNIMRWFSLDSLYYYLT